MAIEIASQNVMIEKEILYFLINMLFYKILNIPMHYYINSLNIKTGHLNISTPLPKSFLYIKVGKIYVLGGGMCMGVTNCLNLGFP